MPAPAGPPAVRAARAAGLALGALFGPLATLRRGRPLHPRGTVLRGTLRLGDDPDAPGGELRYAGPAVVRLSRSVGLPPGVPDVHGVAVRWEVDGRPQDLLLSGTGTGRLTRFVLAPRLTPWGGTLGSLMPFRTADGPVLLGAAPVAGARGDAGGTDVRVDLVLLSARAGGPWHRVGRLVAEDVDPGADVRFDPVLHVPAPYRTYGWAAALRLPSYAAARRRGPLRPTRADRAPGEYSTG
ncbi:hypothetical protein [Cellulomonas shaoxiangyii]|uniref:Phosphodiesterase n=1 Tax=Cellulomonas shaoxiangyii TaxID=2566013 RepID=A0A4P7SIU6_9CELL|nr:hypothetical protein [Cellulomonas shaoxiangyii]QCB93701.1 hypothetical protein E5225_09155 [Cellulomonas shaoxiangyii]TGY86182.1 hypothetical protein E5226_03455 [Cellulomonas shaoxiangyii]